MIKRKRRVFNKINLLETSIVGIPAYPDAHMSFIKTLAKLEKVMTNHGSSRQLDAEDNTNIITTREDEKMPEDQEETPQEEVEEQPKEEVEESTDAEEEVEEAEPEAEESTDKSAEIKEIVKSVFLEALKEMKEDKRGLIAKDEVIEDKNLSAGELAVKYNIFKSSW